VTWVRVAAPETSKSLAAAEAFFATLYPPLYANGF
jgi:hypothetical protein